MKKLATKLLCGILLSSVMLCGCNQVTETTSAISETQTETTATTTETEPAPTQTEDTRPEINVDNMMKVADLYASKVPDGKNAVEIYADGVRGFGFYSVDNGVLNFGYDFENGSRFDIRISSGKRTAKISIDLIYKGGKRLYAEGDTGIDTFEKLIDDLVADTATYVNYIEKSAVDSYAENIKKDIPVMYSRFIVLADKAFPELGLKLEDLGVDLGTKYRTVDPAQLMSMEPSVTKTLEYKNGVSTKGNKLWTDYFYNAVGIMGGTTRKDWRSVYGQSSATMLNHSDQVQLVAGRPSSGKKYAVLYYYTPNNDVTGESEMFSIQIDDASTKKTKKLSVSMAYELQLKQISVGKGVTAPKYTYWVNIKAKPGQYDKVFASKESLKKYASVNLFVRNKKGIGVSAWGKKANIDKLKKSFEADGCTYYTKDQIIDKLWEHHENFLESIDSGMKNMDTSLADIGVNWKKKS